jgi:hypothetical protein
MNWFHRILSDMHDAVALAAFEVFVGSHPWK